MCAWLKFALHQMFLVESEKCSGRSLDMLPISLNVWCRKYLFGSSDYPRILTTRHALPLKKVVKIMNGVQSLFIFSRLYRVVVHPIVWAYWEENRQMVLLTMPEDELVRLTGDGQFDSPGYSALFCFYRLLYNIYYSSPRPLTFYSFFSSIEGLAALIQNNSD